VRSRGRGLRGRAALAAAAAAIGLLVATPASGAGPGYNQVYTAIRQVSINPSVDLVLLRSNDSGGPNLSVAFAVEGTVALRAGYSYLVEFNRSSANASCVGGAASCSAHVTCGADASGAPSCSLTDRSGVGAVRWSLANASTTVLLSVAKAVLPAAAGFCLWARASGPGAPGNSLGCGVAPVSGSGGNATGSPLGSTLGLALVAIAVIIALLVAIGVALFVRRRRRETGTPPSEPPPGAPPGPPTP
jgi:hypothetical protein